MKKILTWFFSIALILAIASVPLFADRHLKKVVAQNQPKATASINAQTRQKSMVKGKKMRGYDRIRKKSVNGFSMPKSSDGIMKSQNQVIANENGTYPKICGSMLYSDAWVTATDYGVYSIPTSASGQFSKIISTPQLFANYGGAVKDGVYYFNTYYDLYGLLEYFESYGFDIATGKQVYKADLSGDPSLLCPGGMALDPLSGNIYGIAYTSDLNAEELVIISYDGVTPKKTPIAQFDQWFIAFAIDGNGQFYGIMEALSGEGILCKIDRTTGEVTQIGPTGQYPYYQTGACIDQSSNRMFWTISGEDESSFLTEVDLTSGKATLINKFANSEEMAGLYVDAPIALDTAPAVCSGLSADFEGEALSGKVSFKTPTTLYDGTTATGKMDVTVLMNGALVNTVQGLDPGATGSVNVSVPAAGRYVFTVYAANSSGDGPKTGVTVWVGPDAPSATTATAKYENGTMTISWLPVSEGINGGYLDPAEISYTIKDSKGNILKEGLTATSYSFSIDEPESLTTLYYTVTVVYKGVSSVASRTNIVVLGSIIPPYSSDFSTDAGFAGWTLIDANGDGEVWVGQSDGSVGISYNSYMAMDDWLFTPPIKMEAGKSYELSFIASSYSSSFPERLEVKMGDNNTVESMTTVIVEPTDIKSTYADGGQVITKVIVPAADGNYFIGFHGISDADMFNLYLWDISISSGVVSGAPAQVDNLKAEPGDNGALECTLSFNAPTKTMNGDDLSSLSKIEIYRGQTLVKTIDSPSPGAYLSYKDIVPVGGKLTYKVIAYNASGAGAEAVTEAFVGFDLPKAPTGVTIARTSVDGQVTVNWQAVTQDVNGLTLGADDVTYDVCRYENGWKTVAEDIKGNTFSYQAVAAGTQEFVQMAVFAKTTAGLGKGTSTEMIPVGTPYNGMNETFAGGESHYIMGFTPIGDCIFDVYSDTSFEDITSVTHDGGFMAFYAGYRSEGGNLYSGLISLENIENPGLTYYTYNIGTNDDANTIAVSVRESSSDKWTLIQPTTAVYELCRGNGDSWNKVTLPLSSYAGKTIEIQFTILTQTYVYTFLDDITVGSILGNDLAVTGISAPANVRTGEKYNVNVNVANEGAKDALSYTVALYANNELVAIENGANLASGKSQIVEFEITMSPVAKEAVKLYAEIIYTDDENSSNNRSAAISVSPMISNLPVATSLVGYSTEDGVQLSWEEPNLEGGIAQQVTDDFEDANGVSDKYGDWTFYDGDGSAVGGFQNMEIPGIEVGVTAGSFWTWDNTVIQANQTFAAHSGEKYLFALFRYDDGPTDDWAISPELYGGEQTISFYAKSYSSSYPEKIQVYYSTGSTNIGDFKPIASSLVSEVPAEWTQYAVALPAGAKYFAIRSFSTGSFMLMVDDVTYSPAGLIQDVEIAGYNVYRNGVKINDVPVEETEYLDTTAVNGEEYSYTVTVVYTDKGESAGSNVVKIIYDELGVEGVNNAISVLVKDRKIVIENAEGLDITVASVNGAVIYASVGESRNEINVTSGIYMVKAGKFVRKVLVK